MNPVHPYSGPDHNSALQQSPHESPVQQNGRNFLGTILEKATTPLSLRQSNREWTAAALFPIINLFTQFVTFHNASVTPQDQQASLGVGQPQARQFLHIDLEEEDPLSPQERLRGRRSPYLAAAQELQNRQQPQPLEQRVTTLNIPLEKLKSLVVGNIAALIISLGVAYFAGFGLTLVHGLAHLAILCSAVNLADIVYVAQSQGKLSDLKENLLGEAIKGSGRRRRVAHSGRVAPQRVEVQREEELQRFRRLPPRRQEDEKIDPHALRRYRRFCERPNPDATLEYVHSDSDTSDTED